MTSFITFLTRACLVKADKQRGEVSQIGVIIGLHTQQHKGLFVALFKMIVYANRPHIGVVVV